MELMYSTYPNDFIYHMAQTYAGGGGESSGRVVTSLMQFFQEKYAPKVRAAARKPAVRGRGLVGSALASIAEGPGGAALRSSQVTLVSQQLCAPWC